MKATELIAKLQALVAEHGNLEVLSCRFGDYLDDNPVLIAEKRFQSPWASGWVDYDDSDPNDKPRTEAMVCYLTH